MGIRSGSTGRALFKLDEVALEFSINKITTPSAAHLDSFRSRKHLTEIAKHLFRCVAKIVGLGIP